MLYGIIPEPHIGKENLKTAIELRAYGFDDINDIKINSYTIKKNNKEIKKKLKFETKLKMFKN